MLRVSSKPKWNTWRDRHSHRPLRFAVERTHAARVCARRLRPKETSECAQKGLAFSLRESACVGVRGAERCAANPDAPVAVERSGACVGDGRDRLDRSKQRVEHAQETYRYTIAR